METLHTSVRRDPADVAQAAQVDPRAAKIFARTMYKDMVGHGLNAEQILAVAAELIAQVTQELKHHNKDI